MFQFSFEKFGAYLRRQIVLARNILLTSLFFAPFIFIAVLGLTTYFWNLIVPDLFGPAVTLGFIQGVLKPEQAFILGFMVWLVMMAAVGEILPAYGVKVTFKTYLRYAGHNFSNFIRGAVQAVTLTVLIGWSLALLLMLLWWVFVPIFSPSGIKLHEWPETLTFFQAASILFPSMFFPLWIFFARRYRVRES